MNIQLKRIAKKETYTIGKLYLDGVYFCDTIEDKDRGLNQTMSINDIKKKIISDCKREFIDSKEILLISNK